MKENLISKINGVDIVTVDKDGETYVPIKPICEAIGIDADAQWNKLNSEDLFNPVVLPSNTTGSDGNHYDMCCIRLRHIFGWLFTIDLEEVAPETHEAVARNIRECYDVLYEYCFKPDAIRLAKAEIEALKAVNEAKQRVMDAEDDLQEAEEHLDAIRKARTDSTLTQL